MKKRNKRYSPKNINPNAYKHAVMMVKPLSDDAKQIFVDEVYIAIEAMSKGVAQKAHFDTLARMVDVSLMLLHNLFDNQESYEVVNRAWRGMVRARDRYRVTSRIAFDGEAYIAVKEAGIVFSELINQITGYEYVRFAAERERQIALGNHYKGKEAA